MHILIPDVTALMMWNDQQTLNNQAQVFTSNTEKPAKNTRKIRVRTDLVGPNDLLPLIHKLQPKLKRAALRTENPRLRGRSPPRPSHRSITAQTASSFTRPAARKLRPWRRSHLEGTRTRGVPSVSRRRKEGQRLSVASCVGLRAAIAWLAVGQRLQ